MPTFSVVQLQEPADLILVSVVPAFGEAPPDAQRRMSAALQVRAHATGLQGTVVPVWNGGDGEMHFFANSTLQALVRGLDLMSVMQQPNAQLTWG